MKKLIVVVMAIAIIAMAGVAMASDTNTVTVNANVGETCKVTGTSAVSFTLDPASASNATANGSITYWCTRGASGTLAISGYGNDSNGSHYMVSTSTATEKIKYTLTAGTSDSYTGQGKGTPKTLTITGSVSNGDYINAMALTDYADTVTYTISP